MTGPGSLGVHRLFAKSYVPSQVSAHSISPSVTIAPSLLGEVTHYVADVRKAHDLLGWAPQTPLDDGIPRAVAWFKEWRMEHPFDEERPLVHDRADEIPHGFKQPAGAA